MKMRWTFHIKRLHIERSNDTGISVLKDNPSFANLFITQKLETNYNGEPQLLKVSQPTPISLYREYIYTISALRLFSETKLKNCFQSQSDTNSSRMWYYCHNLQIWTNIMEQAGVLGLGASLTCLDIVVDIEYDAFQVVLRWFILY